MTIIFTYICILRCNIFISYTSCDVSSVKWFNDEHYSYLHVSHVQQQLRSLKMDDIYIYHVYTLSLLLPNLRGITVGDIYIYNLYTLSLVLITFQVKQSRRRLCFQEEGQSRGRLCFQGGGMMRTYLPQLYLVSPPIYQLDLLLKLTHANSNIRYFRSFKVLLKYMNI